MFKSKWLFLVLSIFLLGASSPVTRYPKSDIGVIRGRPGAISLHIQNDSENQMFNVVAEVPTLSGTPSLVATGGNIEIGSMDAGEGVTVTWDLDKDATVGNEYTVTSVVTSSVSSETASLVITVTE